MADVRFYHLERQSLDQILPQLVTKALAGDHRIVIRAANDAQAEQINAHLWTFDPESFIPHGSAKDGHEAEQPVLIASASENLNKASVLILAGGQDGGDVPDGFSLVCDMIDGRDEQAVTAARQRWKIYKDAGHDVTYWQQSAAGGWEKKA